MYVPRRMRIRYYADRARGAQRCSEVSRIYETYQRTLRNIDLMNARRR